MRRPHLLLLWLPLALGPALAGCGDETPYFESVLHPAVLTSDTVGPYLVEAYVVAPAGVGQVLLRVAGEPEGPFADQYLEKVDGGARRGRWAVELPGRPVGSGYYYYLQLTDQNDQVAITPDGAPEHLYWFRVEAPE